MPLESALRCLMVAGLLVLQDVRYSVVISQSKDWTGGMAASTGHMKGQDTYARSFKAEHRLYIDIEVD